MWDLFLAHAGPSSPEVECLYDELASKCKVFLDSRCLIPGDDWDFKILEAQRQSRVSVVVVSDDTPESYYQREEIAAAIGMARNCPQTHRVVPVYLNDRAKGSDSLPYGLRIKQGISFKEKGGAQGVAAELLRLLSQLQAIPKGDEISRMGDLRPRRPVSTRVRMNPLALGIVIASAVLGCSAILWILSMRQTKELLIPGPYACTVGERTMQHCEIVATPLSELELRFASPENGLSGFRDSFVGTVTKSGDCYKFILLNTYAWEDPPRSGSEISTAFVCPQLSKWVGMWTAADGFSRSLQLSTIRK